MNDVDSSVKEFDVDCSGYACWIVYDWKIGETKITLDSRVSESSNITKTTGIYRYSIQFDTEKELSLLARHATV